MRATLAIASILVLISCNRDPETAKGALDRGVNYLGKGQHEQASLGPAIGREPLLARLKQNLNSCFENCVHGRSRTGLNR